MSEETITEATDLTELSGSPIDRTLSGVRRGRVIISMTPSGCLLMQDDPSPPTGWSDKCVIEHQGESFLAIEGQTQIEIVLTGPTQWEFDLDGGMLLFKKASHQKWYTVEYSPGQQSFKNIILNAKPSGQGRATHAAHHSFNLMVLINQVSPSGVVGRPLAVIIDPDAKNPPPIMPLTGPSGPAVPVLSSAA